MRNTNIILAIIISAILFVSCSDKGSDSSGLALLAFVQQPASEGSDPAKTLAVGATATAGAVTGALSSPGAPEFALVLDKKKLEKRAKDMLLAHVRQQNEQRIAQLKKHLRDPGSTRIIPTAFTCQDGACNSAASETLIGTANCQMGGTVTANGVNITSTSSVDNGSYNLSMSMNGPFTFNSCVGQTIDYGKLPTFALMIVNLSGDVTLSGTTTGQGTSSSNCQTDVPSVGYSTCSGSGSSESEGTRTVVSSALTVNGVTGAVDIVDSTELSGTTTSTTVMNMNTGEMQMTLSGTYSGTVSVTGTAMGETVNIFQPLNVSFTCTNQSCTIN